MQYKVLFVFLQVYSKDSKHRSDSLDEASQFSDLEDQIGTSPAHKPAIDSAITSVVKTEATPVFPRTEATTKNQTLEFLKNESEHSSIVHAPTTLAFTEKVSAEIRNSHSKIILILKQTYFKNKQYFTGFIPKRLSSY